VQELIAWVGRLGRRGGVLLLLLAAPFVWMSVALSSRTLPDGATEHLFYAPALWLLAGSFGLTGLYLLVTGGPWRRDTRWTPLAEDALQAAIRSTPAPFCLCVDCRVVLPYEVAVGRCPRCGGASACFEIFSAGDRNDALAAAGFERSGAPPTEVKQEYLRLMRLRGAEGEAYVAERVEKLKATQPGHDDEWYLRWLLADLRRAKGR
jgi:hypothetical protein